MEKVASIKAIYYPNAVEIECDGRNFIKNDMLQNVKSWEVLCKI